MTRAVVVVNPAAGGGRTERLWPSLREDLRRLGLVFDWAPTTAAVGALRTGRGRDASRNLGLASDLRVVVRRVVEGAGTRIDLVRPEWPDGARRYVVGAAGAGFGARVAHRSAVGGGRGAPAWSGRLTAAVVANGVDTRRRRVDSTPRGYTRVLNEETRGKARGRLRRIEGQVQGLQRMLDSDAYCVDILLQISAVQGALDQVQKLLLGRHIESCVAEALRTGSKSERQQKIDELLDVFARFGAR